MPDLNEHAARVADEGACEGKSFRRMNQGKGVSLILCSIDGKMKAVSYRFNKDMYTPSQAKEWCDKHNLDIKEFAAAKMGDGMMNAKLSMKAANGMPEVDGAIWSSGMHHVFVNDKPARVYVPEKTIMQTFESVRDLIKDQGRMPIGIDHLSDNILEENEILAKMNLLDVGDVTKVGTDGKSIFILDSALTNDAIKALNAEGQLPAYSIVGAMDAKPCPSGKADYVVEAIDVERVDFVEEGGCQVCKVGAQPNDLILTSKVSKEDIIMANDSEAPKEEVVEEVNETPEPEVAEEIIEVDDSHSFVEEPKDKIVTETVEEPKEEVVEEVSELDELKKEIEELKELLKPKDEENLGGKKPKVEAKTSEFDVDKEIKLLIKAGKATPKMGNALRLLDEDAFKAMAKVLPKTVSLGMKSKTSKPKAEKEPEKEVPYLQSEQFKKDAAAIGVKV